LGDFLVSRLERETDTVMSNSLWCSTLESNCFIIVQEKNEAGNSLYTKISCSPHTKKISTTSFFFANSALPPLLSRHSLSKEFFSLQLALLLQSIQYLYPDFIYI
jgi:hypothetical protein